MLRHTRLLIMLIFIISSAQQTVYSQRIILINGDSLITSTLNQYKFLINKVFEVEELNTLMYNDSLVCDQKDSLLLVKDLTIESKDYIIFKQEDIILEERKIRIIQEEELEEVRKLLVKSERKIKRLKVLAGVLATIPVIMSILKP